MTIRFYRVRDPNGELSNHSAHGFELDGLFWPTIEHYYQAQKFAGTPYTETIRHVPRLWMPSVWAKPRTIPCVCPDWDVVKEDVRFRATLAKYETHADLREICLAAGEEELVEDSSMDYYWGCGKDDSSLNRYGHVLMQVRALLQGQAT